MIGWGAATLISIMLGIAPPAAQSAGETYEQVSVREQLIVRVPVRMNQVTPMSSLFEWKESKGPRCIPARSIARAALLSENSVDLILRDRRRVRAQLEKRCPELDYYYGFYISPNPDGMVCADRDLIRSRIGGQCGIERFRLLQAVRRPERKR